MKQPRSFHWLNLTQFLGALNDNAFKLLIIFYLIDRIGVSAAEKAAGASGLTYEMINAIANGLFAIPFLCFSALAGAWADKVSKQRVIISAKGLELLIMILGMTLVATGQTYLLYGVLFIMAAQSTLFGPAKFGIIPELVSRDRLAKANGLMTACTYLAIIIGTALTPLVLELDVGRRYLVAGGASAAIALIGLATATRIKETKAGGGKMQCSLFFVKDIARTLSEIRSDRFLFSAVLGAAFFLFIGAFVQINVIPYGIDELGLSNARSGYLFLGTALGIGVGALLSGWLSGRNIETGIIPFGALGISLCSFALSFSAPDVGRVGVLMFLLGASAGLFIVPINAYVQFAAPHGKLGKVLASMSFLSWTGVLAAALLSMICQRVGIQARESFLITGTLTGAAFFVSLWLIGDFALRFIGKFITRCCYRIRPYGLEHIPVDGPALLISNHVSFVDAVLISACLQRRVRFLMYRGYFEKPLFKPFFKLMGTIPISFEDGPRKLVGAFKSAREAMEEGYIVCVFAEGTLTKNGTIREFQPGFERMVKGTQVPIIPVYLGGVWGSVFSWAHGSPLSRWPQRFPYPVQIHFGRPLQSDTPAHEVRLAVQELSSDYFTERASPTRTLDRTFLRTARLNWRKKAMADTTGRTLTFGRAATAALLIRNRIRTLPGEESYIGVLMPTTAAGALVNLGITLSGRIPVNLNYTASSQALKSALEQTGIRHVISVDVFLEKLGEIELPGTKIMDVKVMLTSADTREKLRCLLAARLAPLCLIAPPRDPHQVATVIFSSGSTGTPKGVQLTHHNILSNIEGFRMLVGPKRDEVICSPLPFFHSFGFTVGLWLPMISGFAAAYHPNPVEAGAIGEIAEQEKATIIVATPTFLLGYIRKVKPEQFASLRLVVVGAEKLKSKVSDAFEKRFGMRPYEGYGATECAPVISVNVPDWEGGGSPHPMRKEGTAGAAIPGVCTKVVDIETGELKGVDEEGLLWVKGPNVMKGYLEQPEKTEEVLVDGWYNTGDVVKVDADGFITITDRLTRFSKIGGEMVPHTAVEETLLAADGVSPGSLAVTSVPHETKGEQLAVLFTAEAGSAEALHQAATNSDLPNLWRPSASKYFQVDEIPVLGTGKLDLRGIKTLAAEKVDENG